MNKKRIGAKNVTSLYEKPIYKTKLFKITFGIMITVVLFLILYYPFRGAGYADIDAKLISLVISTLIALVLVNIRRIVHRK